MTDRLTDIHTDIRKVDSQNQLDAVLSLPDHLRDALSEGAYLQRSVVRADPVLAGSKRHYVTCVPATRRSIS